MLCPACGERLDPASHRCPAGHSFETTDGVLRLLEPAFGARLQNFLDGFQELREADGRRIHEPSVFPRLPFATEVKGDPEWRMRIYDLEIIRRLTAGRGLLTVLDVGAWNGWLSHQLAMDGHRVTAVEYFDDELDGIGAHRFFPTSWRPIQLDLRDLSVLEERFDLVVLNRCVQFFPDPPAMAAHVSDRVADGGMLVVTGLEFFTETGHRRRAVKSLVTRLRAHDLEPFIPIKGYLDRDDRARFQALGIDLRSYPQLRMRLAALRSLADGSRGRTRYGVWTR